MDSLLYFEFGPCKQFSFPAFITNLRISTNFIMFHISDYSAAPADIFYQYFNKYATVINEHELYKKKIN